MTWIKKHIWLLIFAFFAIPMLINIFVISDNPFGWGIAGKPSDWIIFWATYLGAFASFAMVFMTWQSLKQNQAQLEEMKRQFEAEREPNLVLSLGFAQNHLFLKVTNTGVMPAYNINLTVNQDFYNAIPDEAKKCFDRFITPFFVDGKSTKYVYIGYGNDLEKLLQNKNIVLTVTGEHCDKYPIQFSCALDQVLGKRFAKIVDELTFAVEDIDKSISSAKALRKYLTIQQSLHYIAHRLNKEQIDKDHPNLINAFLNMSKNQDKQ